MHFLRYPQNDLMLGGCSCWWGGKLVSCLSNTQPLCLLSPYSQCHFSTVSVSVAYSLLACPACCGKVCHSSLFSCSVGQKTVVVMKKWLPMNSVCPTPCIFLFSCRTVPWVGIILKAAFKSCYPKYVVMLYMYPLPSQSLNSFIPNLLCFFLECTAKTPLCPLISQLLYPMPNFLWDCLVWNVYYLGSWKFYCFSTDYHNQDMLCEVDFDYFQSETLYYIHKLITYHDFWLEWSTL